MQKIRYGLVVLLMLSGLATSATAEVRINFGLPSVSIGINLPFFPMLVPVPGYPVYYAPQLDSNYFFYDGMYWVYQDDNWYASSWYNGPWGVVDPEIVPLFVLRIPVAYYRNRPEYFRGWHSNEPPRWGQHWGRDWEGRRGGWDRWDRRSVPSRAPRPDYQRQYSGDRYPRTDQQHELHNRNYRYQPQDTIVREHFKQTVEKKASAPAQRGRQDVTPQRSPKKQEAQRPATFEKSAPAVQRTETQHQNTQRPKSLKKDAGQRAQSQHQPPSGVQDQRHQSKDQGQKSKGNREPQEGRGGKGQDPRKGVDQVNGQEQKMEDERARGRNN